MNDQSTRASGDGSSSPVVGRVHLTPEMATEPESEFHIEDDENVEEIERRGWSRQALIIGAGAVIISIIALLIILQGVYQLV